MIVPTWAASSTCGIWASMGLVRSCTIKLRPCALAQHALNRAPVCVLQVFSATPAQLTAKLDCLPIMRAFIEEQRFPRGNTMDINAVPFEVVRKGLLDIENHL